MNHRFGICFFYINHIICHTFLAITAHNLARKLLESHNNGLYKNPVCYIIHFYMIIVVSPVEKFPESNMKLPERTQFYSTI